MIYGDLYNQDPINIISESVKDDIDSCESIICTVLMHLLKVTAQPEKMTGSWFRTIYNGINNISKSYNTSTNIKNGLDKRNIFINKTSTILDKAEEETHLERGYLYDKYLEMTSKIKSIDDLISYQFIKDYIDNIIKNANIPELKRKEDYKEHDKAYNKCVGGR